MRIVSGKLTMCHPGAATASGISALTTLGIEQPNLLVGSAVLCICMCACLDPGYLRGGTCRTGTERGALGASGRQIPG